MRRRELVEMVRECWNKQNGVQVIGMEWNKWKQDEVEDIFECLGGRAVAGISEVYARDYNQWRAGMPDFIHVETKKEKKSKTKKKTEEENEHEHEHERKEGEDEDEDTEEEKEDEPQQAALEQEETHWKYAVKWVEVKGPRDRLSSRQEAWIEVLLGVGAEVEVCKIIEGLPEDNNKPKEQQNNNNNNSNNNNNKKRTIMEEEDEGEVSCDL